MSELLPLDEALARAQGMGVFDTVGLTLPEHLEPIEYYCVSQQVQVLDNSVGWWRADLALRIKTDFPDNYKEVWRQFLPRYEWYSLENDVRTAMRYTMAERWDWTVEGPLYYSHCRVASHLETDIRRDVLNLAAGEGWNVRMLENYITHGKPLLQAPAPSRDVKYQEKCSEWLISIPVEQAHVAEPYVRSFSTWLESQSS